VYKENASKKNTIIDDNCKSHSTESDTNCTVSTDDVLLRNDEYDKKGIFKREHKWHSSDKMDNRTIFLFVINKEFVLDWSNMDRPRIQLVRNMNKPRILSGWIWIEQEFWLVENLWMMLINST
jgi:hypothetical protein